MRFGGAGACFPRLLVVRRICTTDPDFPVDEKVLSLDDESKMIRADFQLQRNSFCCTKKYLTGKRSNRLLIHLLLLLLLVLLSHMRSHLGLLPHLGS